MRGRHATPENRWKTTIGVISKNNFARAAHYFLYISCCCFARLQRETLRNFLVTRFMEEMSYVFPFTFFHCRSFPPCIGGHWHFSFQSPPLHKIFMLFFQQKNVSFGFSSLALNPCRPFSRWASLVCRPLSLFLCLSLALYSKFVDMTIYLSLIL